MDNRILWPGWETVRIIGRGSYGAVYEIERELFEGEKEKAALKVISIPHNESEVNDLRTSGYDDRSITRIFEGQSKELIKEYALMNKLRGHTNIVNCQEFRHVQQEDGLGWDVYIRMELLEPFTSSLGSVIEEKQVAAVGEDLCRALILCRKYNIVHRDIKPQNIFVSDTGDYKLGDFGIARTMEHTSGATSIGSPNYMAPEVAKGLDYGHRADIYSLGLVLYWMLNERRLPFFPLPPKLPTSAENETALKRRVNGDTIPAPKNGSAALKAIVLKACAYKPEDRYASAEDMLKALNALETAGENTVIKGDAPKDDTIIEHLPLRKKMDTPTGKRWVCSKCKTENWDNDQFCKYCRQPRNTSTIPHGIKKIILCGIIAILLILFIYLAIPKGGTEAPPSLSTPSTSNAVIETTARPVITPNPTPTPISVPENITIYSDGRVNTMYEYINGEKVVWTYHYDSNNIFMYRSRIIPEVEVYWSDDCIPNSYTTYHCFEPIYDCLSFTYNFTIPEVYSGTGTGDRTLYVKTCNGEWKTVRGFSYPEYEPVHVVVDFDVPMDLMGVGSLRNIDDPGSSYYIEVTLEDVLIADYNYVGY